jgi:hypothetical protein
LDNSELAGGVRADFDRYRRVSLSLRDWSSTPLPSSHKVFYSSQGFIWILQKVYLQSSLRHPSKHSLTLDSVYFSSSGMHSALAQHSSIDPERHQQVLSSTY